jgi:hypothetical protein
MIPLEEWFFGANDMLRVGNFTGIVSVGEDMRAGAVGEDMRAGASALVEDMRAGASALVKILGGFLENLPVGENF